MVILGIDPGVATTGYGFVRVSRKKGQELRVQCLGGSYGYNVIKTSPLSPPASRLKKIHQELNKLINKYQPDVLAVENVYFFKNLKTAIPVSQVKGVILLTAAKKGLPVYEFTPLQVKMAITGYGRAEKPQMQRLIQTMLNLKELPSPDDVADALAVAICCGYKLARGLS